MKLQEAREFVARFNTGVVTPEENAAFLQWLRIASGEELTIIADTHEAMVGSWGLPGAPSGEWIMQLERKLDSAAAEAEEKGRKWATERRKMENEEGISSIRLRRRMKTGGRAGIRWVAAASVAGLLTAGAYFYVHHSKLRPDGSDGSGSGRNLLSMAVSIPRGSAQKAFTLEDGSKVWLNAGSILKYPQRFADEERLVELSGEAFFDVSGSAQRPFRVRIRDAEVEVEGTYFDVMAYDDEPASRTTLIDGAVKVTSGQQSEMLRPGEQAEVTFSSPGETAAIKIREGIDTNRILDWKKGIYHLDGTDLRTVIRMIARTYGLTVQYQATAPDPLINGTLDLHKSLDISLQLLRVMLPQNIQLIKNEKSLTVTSS